MVQGMKTYKIFISHAWTTPDEYYNRLVNLLDQVPGFKWENCCKPRSDYPNPASQTDSALEQELRYQIYPADIVIILLDMCRLYSKWIEKETNLALEMKKPIIGILPWGNSQMPPELEQAIPKTVTWDVVSIIDAISGA